MLNRDVHPSRQPQGSYRYALNTTVETREGNLMSLSNDVGNKFNSFVPYSVIGTCYLGGDRHLIFSTDNESSEIGLFDGVYSAVLNLDCLNFSTAYPIDSIYRVREGCKDTIYFTDGLNPVRAIELGVTYTTCDDLSLFKGFTIPSITKTVTSGGRLVQGSYQVSIRYLDSDENGTNWFLDTSPVNVFEGTTYETIKGTDSVTNKAIQINLTSLDSSFPYYQIAVNEYTSGQGVLSRTLVSPKIQTSQSAYIVTGVYEGWVETVIEDLQIDQIGVESALHIEQIENRLVLANIKEKQVDWCSYQEIVNQIEVGWTTEAVPKYVPARGNSMFPEKETSFMGDEVYALSVAYILEDGYRTPFFNIPGRAKTLNDSRTLTVVQDILFPTIDQIDLNDVRHLDLETGDTVERWRVQNTAKSDGTLSYHELTDVYPDTEDCNGNKIWGSLAGTPIRHHKMPARSLVELYDEEFTYPLYFTIDNVELPEGAVGYIIGMANANTIVDKGFVFPVWKVGVNYFFGEAEHDPRTLIDEDLSQFIRDSSRFAVMTPKLMFLKENVLGDYFHVESNHFREGARVDAMRATFEPGTTTQAGIWLKFTYYDYGDETLRTVRNRVINSGRFYQPNQQYELTEGAIKNGSQTNSFVQFDTIGFNTDGPGLFYGGVKSVVETLQNLDVINYRLAVDNVQTDSAVIRGGDTFITPLTFENISEFETRAPTPRYVLNGSLLTNLFVESKINTFLRHEGTDYGQTSFRPPTDYVPGLAWEQNVAHEFLFNKYTNEVNDFNTEFGGVGEQYTGYNLDFGVTDRILTFNTIPTNFDCCSKCLGEYTSRIIYSSQSFQEEKTDFYRVFLPNNYRDIESEKGEITNLFRFKENLYIQTTDALWYIPHSLQERATSEGVVTFLGTGDFFAIPPRLVLDTVKGGCVDKWSVVKVPQGVFFYDSEGGDPYMFTGQLQELSDGMRSWFEEQHNTLQGLVEADGGTLPRSPYFGGAVAVYDTRHERIFLTWKNYEPYNWGRVTQGIGITEYDVVNFDDTAKRFYVNSTYVDPQDSTYFCDKSWTLSYSLLTGAWTSFHSFLPDWITFGKSKVLSFKEGAVWTHGDGEYNVYYNILYPHILEYAEISPVTKIWDSVRVYSDGKFNKAVIYNSKQGTQVDLIEPGTPTGYLLLRVKDTAGQISIVEGDNNWYFNKFYDTGIEISEWNEGCVDLSRTDRVFTNTAVKKWFDRPPIEDKYILVRLIQNERSSITTNFIQTINGESEK